MKPRPSSDTRTEVVRVEGDSSSTRSDRVATEEPLEIRLRAGGKVAQLAVTMRTPGSDFELAAGFLHSEGVVCSADEIGAIRYCDDEAVDAEQMYNIVTVDLNSGRLPDVASLERHFFTSSACGVCGKASIDALEPRVDVIPSQGPIIVRELVESLPDKLRAKQGLFEKTGGLHAAGLFDANGAAMGIREDVGRHNAVDKLIGWALLQGRVPLSDTILMVSGRTSFEIVQKAAVAGIPIVCAVSAPSSLAIETAERFGMTLIGFVRDGRFNIYAGAERVALGAASSDDLASAEAGSLMVEGRPGVASGSLTGVEDREPQRDRAGAADYAG
ncbi:MAG: FdhD protein [Actinomycetota bacterium]|jgi:FdhD protein|nr:FdhD protein [Actinomycetota bacterium]